MAGGVCVALECHRSFAKEWSENKRSRELQEQENKRRWVESQKARALELRRAEVAGIRDPESYPLTLIPSFSAPITEISDRRRQGLRDHLMSVINLYLIAPEAPPEQDDATAAPKEEAAPTSAPSVLDRACARCGGHCCRKGGEEAYLAEDTIRRYVREHPGTRPLDLIEAYLARVGQESYEGSCIYHGSTGCTLPREMRSDICNGYFCSELSEFQRDHGSRPARGFFATQGYADTILAAAFVDEFEVREVPVPLD
jgi:hypothetical protein